MSDSSANPPQRLTMLLDTNAFIALEPASRAPEAGLSRAADLVRLAHDGGYRFFLSQATARDINQDADIDRRATNLALARKYLALQPIPPPASLLDSLGEQAPPAARDTNDDRDLELLSALWVDAVDFLVTDDDRLRRRGRRAGLVDRIFTIAEAAEFLERLVPRATAPPPAVDALVSYQLDATDPIFRSLRDDYPHFDNWLKKVRSEHRPAWVIKTGTGYGAIMLVKDEPNNDLGLPGKVLKVSTFKVASHAAGRSYGELLLKTLFTHLHHGNYDTVYVTAYPKQAHLIELLEAFGFSVVGDRADVQAELAIVKYRRPVDRSLTDPLNAHQVHGPPFVHPDSRLFVVPVQPNWHDALFPDVEMGLAFWTGTHPYGNALRKAYVSGTRSRLVAPGDAVLFYRSTDLQAVTVVGVVEDVQVSPDPEVIRRFVGRRTVYTPKQLTEMAAKHTELHAMIFRQDRLVDPPMSLRTLQMLGVLNGAPQSITEVVKGGRAWVHQQLAESQ